MRASPAWHITRAIGNCGQLGPEHRPGQYYSSQPQTRVVAARCTLARCQGRAGAKRSRQKASPSHWKVGIVGQSDTTSREAGLAVGCPENPWRSTCPLGNMLQKLGRLCAWAIPRKRDGPLQNYTTTAHRLRNSREAMAGGPTPVPTICFK